MKSNLVFDPKKLKKNTVPFEEVLQELYEKDPKAVMDVEFWHQYFNVLAETRQKQKMTQKQLSTLSGIPRETISRIEKGNRNVKLRTLEALAKGLGKRLEIRFI